MRLTQFEHVSKPLASPQEFVRRWLTSLGVVVVLLLLSLLAGAAGYSLFEMKPIDTTGASYGLSDALYDAAMIMSGMGPVHHPAGVCGKLFASLFAMYSGLLLAVVTGILLAPLLHRVLHHMHLEGVARSKPKKKSRSL